MKPIVIQTTALRDWRKRETDWPNASSSSFLQAGPGPTCLELLPWAQSCSRSRPHLSGVRPTNPAFYTGDQVLGPLIRLCTDQSIATGHLAACTVPRPITRCRGCIGTDRKTLGCFFRSPEKKLVQTLSAATPGWSSFGPKPSIVVPIWNPRTSELLVNQCHSLRALGSRSWNLDLVRPILLASLLLGREKNLHGAVQSIHQDPTIASPQIEFPTRQKVFFILSYKAPCNTVKGIGSAYISHISVLY